MHIFDSLQTALESLANNKLRSFLTALGIIIGVASVIVMVALGTGAQEAVQSRFRGLGSTDLTISSRRQPGFGNQAALTKSITYEETLGLKDLPSVVTVQASLSGTGSVVRGAESLDDTTIQGVAADWITTQNPGYVAGGEFFTAYDVEDKSRVAIIGQTVAQQLFPGEDPVGQEIRINRLHFEVIGLVRELDRPDPRVDPNNIVVLPIATAVNDLFGRDRSVAVRVRVQNEKDISATTIAILAYFRQKHDTPENQQEDVQVTSLSQITQAQSESAQTFSLLVIGMAIVSLIVGGIGIMNVMMVSVTERTREIGVRLAIGARQWDIVQQFLIEAVALSLSGGVLGVAVGILTIPLLTRYRSDLAATLTWQSIVQAFGVALIVGVVFGLYPAIRASRLDPMEALRYE
ncbi:Macrolide export ATP-binding/permease protein MacB [Anaerolineae bacterium]|nr:Macrolide export ATP-binding/permease protein MacB [Anaerolineae bacterium]